MSNKRYPPESKMTDYFTGVGCIGIAWAFLEMHVNHSIWRLANIEQYAGACITSQIAQPIPRFRALIALARHRGAAEAECAALNKMSHKADGLARRRNRLIHDPAFHKDDKLWRLNITADRALDFGMKEVGLHDMEELESDIVSLTTEFRRQMQTILSTLPPFDQRQFEQSPGIDPQPIPDEG